jgi:hypothetical protein
VSLNSSAYGGHHVSTRSTTKVLQSDFYWPNLFKDAVEFVKTCDEWQRAVNNIGKRQEIHINYSLPLEPFDVWGFEFMGPFPLLNGYIQILVAVDYVTKPYQQVMLIISP